MKLACLALAAVAALGAACGGDGTSGVAGDVEVLVPGDVTSASDTTVAPADTAGDSATSIDTGDTGVAPDVADDSAAPDDVAAGDVVPAVVACPPPSLVAQYPPPWPPFPYGDWPPADGCFAGPHDVVIVLGCPSESDGSPSACQTKRAEMADQLYEAGWSSHFIVTGAAVHNQWVEADALYALLVGRGIPAEAIIKEPLAQHTDENIYYATRIMQARGWLSAIVVSEDPGHLMFTGLCDADCCVKLGRMTLLSFPVEGVTVVRAGHYALTPPGPDTSAAECTHIASLGLCVNQDQRKACKDDFQLDAPP